MQKLLSSMTGALALVLLTPGLALAKPPKGGAAPTPPSAHHTTISSVDANSITVIDGAGVSKTYTVSPLTDITIAGNRGKITDLQPNMRVQVTADGDELSAISATDAVPADTTAAAPPKAKKGGKKGGGKKAPGGGGDANGGNDAGGGGGGGE